MTLPDCATPWRRSRKLPDPIQYCTCLPAVLCSACGNVRLARRRLSGSGDENSSRHASAKTAAAGDSGVSGNTNSSDGNAPKPGQEEDDLYDDLYGGLTEKTAGTSTVHSAKEDEKGREGGDDAGVDSGGGDQDAGASSEGGTADAGGKVDRGAETGAGRTASGVAEDIGIRAVMNALKVRLGSTAHSQTGDRKTERVFCLAAGCLSRRGTN